MKAFFLCKAKFSIVDIGLWLGSKKYQKENHNPVF